jgi:hypothetical protein
MKASTGLSVSAQKQKGLSVHSYIKATDMFLLVTVKTWREPTLPFHNRIPVHIQR